MDNDQLTYTKEVPFVNKSNIARYLIGGCCKLAVEFDAAFEKQLQIGTALKQSSHSTHKKKVSLAYNLARFDYTIMNHTRIGNLYLSCFEDTFSNNICHFQVEENRLEIDSTL